MRPRRILRRFVARARHWGVPHIHCPSCGADATLPRDSELRSCFTCKVDWFRQELTGDPAADWALIAARAEPLGPWTVTFRPILVDAPSPGGGKQSTLLDCALIYFPKTAG
jgi:hypothetical protein